MLFLSHDISSWRFDKNTTSSRGVASVWLRAVEMGISDACGPLWKRLSLSFLLYFHFFIYGRNILQASYLHLCTSFIKQYNLVLATRQWCSSAGKVTMGLVESNGSVPPGLWLTGSAPSPMLLNRVWTMMMMMMMKLPILQRAGKLES